MRAAPHDRPRARFHSPSREAGISEAEARKAWAPVLREALRLAALVEAGEVPSRDERALFAGRVIRLKAAFPNGAASAQACAQAFVILARAASAGNWPAPIAPFVAAGARALAELLDAETRAAFERSLRVTGEGGA
jgi:hypothetical protein